MKAQNWDGKRAVLRGFHKMARALYLANRAYIFFLFLILPLDWFAPTGKMLREFGAKPSAPLLVLGSILIFLAQPVNTLRLDKATYRTACLLIFVCFLGTASFWINLACSWSGFGREKNPITQFIAQAALFAAFSIVVVIHAGYFKNSQYRSFALSTLPAVVIIQLTLFILDAVGVVSHAHGLLSLFRIGGGFEMDRPSGLMSEPSYFGAFAAMYGLPLLMIGPAHKRLLRGLLAGILFVAAILIRAKTFIPVLVLEFMVFLWWRGRAVFRLRYIALAIVLVVASAFVIISNATFDLQENLSSVDRFGSTQLALNVADAGYGFTGIGFGQFHFFYRPEFAPNYIFSSEEAQAQMTGSIESRASTYNLYIRILVETGILGLAAFSFLIFKLLRDAKADKRQATLFGMLIVAGSLGFLLTQDTYFYPPLAVGIAILLGCADDRTLRQKAVDV